MKRILIVVLVLLGALVYPIFADPFFEKALTHYYAGQYSPALEQLAKSTEDANQKKLLQALILIKQKNFTEAKAALDQVYLSEKPFGAYLTFLRLELLLYEDPNKTSETLKQLRQLFPKSKFYANVVLNLADTYAKQNNWPAARKLYQELLDSQDNPALKPTLYAKLIRSSIALGDLKTTDFYYQTLALEFPLYDNNKSLLNQRNDIADEPVSANAFFTTKSESFRYFQALYSAGDYDDALAQAQWLLLRYPDLRNNAELMTHKAMSSYLLFKADDAIETFQYVIKTFPRTPWSTKATYYMAKTYQGKKDFENAKYYYLDLISKNPSSEFISGAYYNLYWVMLALNQQAEFEDYFTTFRTQHPRDPNVNKLVWEMGWTAFKGDRTDQAQRIFKLQSSSGDSALKSKLLFWQARLTGEKNKETALEIFKQCATAYPLTYYSFRVLQTYFPDKIDQIADKFQLTQLKPIDKYVILTEMGLGEFAIDELQNKLSVSSGRPRTLIYTLAYVYAKMGDYTNAITVLLSRGFNLDPNSNSIGREIAELLYPKAYWDEVQHSAAEFGVDPYFVLAVMREESSFKPTAKSRSGALGLMQLMPATAMGIAKNVSANWEGNDMMYRPEVNIRFGTFYLSYLKRRFDGNMFYMLSGYNAGPNITKKWAETSASQNEDIDTFVANIPYSETHYYVTRVLKSYWMYRLLYEKKL